MAYESKKKKQTIKEAEELALAKSQFDAYVRARDHGHDQYIQMAKKCDALWDSFPTDWIPVY